MQQEIKITLKAFDHRVLDQAVINIVQTVKRIGAKVKGAIPLPVRISRYIVNRSPHIDKKSREHFEIRTHTRVLIFEASPQIIDALMKLDLASGVHVEIESIGV